MGMGIHGVPCIWRGKIKTADDVSAGMLDRIRANKPLESGDRISVLVNSLGATPREELFTMYRYLTNRFDEIGVSVVIPLVGRYATSMEMTGASHTNYKLNDELEKLLKAPAHCAFWNV